MIVIHLPMKLQLRMSRYGISGHLHLFIPCKCIGGVVKISTVLHLFMYSVVGRPVIEYTRDAQKQQKQL